jgi:limonene-1,2-epoxide hydrolase
MAIVLACCFKSSGFYLTTKNHGGSEQNMNQNREETVREFLGHFAASAIKFDRIETLFSGDAVYRPHPEFDSVVGNKKIRIELERQLGLYKDCDFQIINIGASDRQIFTERHDYVTQNGLRIKINVAAIFDFDKQNKICGWREYWDLGSVQKQLDVSTKEMESYMKQESRLGKQQC